MGYAAGAVLSGRQSVWTRAAWPTRERRGWLDSVGGTGGGSTRVVDDAVVLWCGIPVAMLAGWL